MRNGTTGGRKLGVVIAAVTLTAVLCLAACGPATTQPEKKRVVEVGDMESLTGYGASAAQPILEAEIAYYKYFNEEIGIPGVTVQINWADTGVEAPKSISAYRRFRERGVPIFTSCSSVGPPALKMMLLKDNVPMVSVNTDADLIYPPGNVYCLTPTWAEQFGAFVDYVMEDWDEDRPPKIAFITSDTSWGMAPLEQGIKYAEGLGIEMLPTEFVPFVTLDASTNLVRLSDQEADFAYIHGLPATVVPVLKDAQRLGLLDKITFGGNANGLNGIMLEGAGPAAEGYFAAFPWPFFCDTEVPGIQRTTEMLMETHGRVIMDAGYFTGRIQAAIACEAIRRAAEAVGPENVDNVSVKAGLDSMKNVDFEGLTTITYTPEERRGFTKTRIYAVKNGKIVRLTDWTESPKLVP